MIRRCFTSVLWSVILYEYLYVSILCNSLLYFCTFTIHCLFNLIIGRHVMSTNFTLSLSFFLTLTSEREGEPRHTGTHSVN